MHSQLSIINSFDERIKLDEAGSFIKYYPNYLDANKADEILKILLNDIKWDDSSRHTYGKITKFNRKSSFYAFSGLKYPFSGRTFEGKSMTSTMCEIGSTFLAWGQRGRAEDVGPKWMSWPSVRGIRPHCFSPC